MLYKGDTPLQSQDQSVNLPLKEKMGEGQVEWKKSEEQICRKKVVFRLKKKVIVIKNLFNEGIIPNELEADCCIKFCKQSSYVLLYLHHFITVLQVWLQCYLHLQSLHLSIYRCSWFWEKRRWGLQPHFTGIVTGDACSHRTSCKNDLLCFLER